MLEKHAHVAFCETDVTTCHFATRPGRYVQTDVTTCHFATRPGRYVPHLKFDTHGHT